MIPVIGQAFSVLNYIIAPTIKCNCESGGVVTLVVQSGPQGFVRTAAACPSCQRTYTIAGFTATAEGQMQFAIELGVPQPTLVAQ